MSCAGMKPGLESVEVLDSSVGVLPLPKRKARDKPKLASVKEVTDAVGKLCEFNDELGGPQGLDGSALVLRLREFVSNPLFDTTSKFKISKVMRRVLDVMKGCTAKLTDEQRYALNLEPIHDL